MNTTGTDLLIIGSGVAAAAIDLMHRIHADFSYQSESTEIETPLARVLETKRGVC